MKRGPLLFSLLFLAAGTVVSAQGVEVEAPVYHEGGHWTVLQLDEPSQLPVFERGWQNATFWDLRPPAGTGVALRWSVVGPHAVGLASIATDVGADLALCAREVPGGRETGCQLVASETLGPSGVRASWSSLPGEVALPRRSVSGMAPDAALIAGNKFTDAWFDEDGVAETVEGVALAEGIALTPAGPAEVVLVRETITARDTTRTVFRFVAEDGRDVAVFTAESEIPVRGWILAQADRLADDGLEITYEQLSSSLTAGSIGFLQYSMDSTHVGCLLDTDCPIAGSLCVGADAAAAPPQPGSCHVSLSEFRAGWTGISDAVTADLTNVPYQSDPGDGSSAVTLPEVWDFSTLDLTRLRERTFNSIRDDTGWNGCLTSCALKDQSAAPPDGTWQAYLKIDNYDPAGTFVTRDLFEFNDNDTGANPSIDVPFVVQDMEFVGDRNQICFEDSGGTADDRLLRFFQFTGPDPASAVMGVGDSWASGNWTSCNDAAGLHLTLASVCGDACYPGCPDGAASPRARGMFTNGAGLTGAIEEDGYLKVAAGNYVPALLLLQQTDLEAGADLFGVCNVSATRLRGMDWFWLNERYGLLALISGPNDDGTNPGGLIQPYDWSAFGNRTDGIDVTWGPFPPYQITAEACLNGTKIDWALPADGSNLTAEPGITDWGYVVSWGNQTDPEQLADWAGNPNRSPLPGQGGYLAAPPGGEPTSYVIQGWGGSTINATVTTALSYTDPDAADTLSYRSAAFFRVVEDPATLDPGVFQVGNVVAPFTAKSGTDLDLSWPAVAGASGYSIKVYDLGTGLEVACPAGLDCSPVGTTTTFSSGVTAGVNHGFRVFAVDGCGDPSTN